MAGTSSILICSCHVLPLPPNQAELDWSIQPIVWALFVQLPARQISFCLPAGRLPLDARFSCQGRSLRSRERENHAPLTARTLGAGDRLFGALNFPIGMKRRPRKAFGRDDEARFRACSAHRVPKIEAHPEQYSDRCSPLRRVPALRTVGESDPTGDEKFFSLSRQPNAFPSLHPSISSLKSARLLIAGVPFCRLPHEDFPYVVG